MKAKTRQQSLLALNAQTILKNGSNNVIYLMNNGCDLKKFASNSR